MKRLLPIIALMLSACTMPTMEGPAAPVSSGSVASSSVSQQPVASGSGAITQRLTASGALEVGATDAPVSLTLFTNTSCPYCQQFSQDHLPRLIDEYVRKGDLTITIIPFALAKYPESERSALLQLCAAKQHKGMAMHDLLMTTAIDSAAYRTGLTTLGLDQSALQTCTDADESRATIAAQQSFAQSLGITLIPTYLLNGEIHTGLPYYGDLRGEIDAALRR